jgi:hypothetical protein
MASRDWLPEREVDLIEMMNIWYIWLSDTKKIAAFEWKSAECSNVILKIMNFLAARKDHHAVNSSVNRLLKDEAKVAAKTAMRNFANSSIRYNSNMAETDRLTLGIKDPAAHHTPRPDPIDSVDFDFKSNPSSHLIISPYRIAGGRSRGKGRYHGAEVRFWVLGLDAPPPISADHPGWRGEISTASPWKHTFEEEELGMRLYLAMRWQNDSLGKDQSKGKGLWSAIQSIVIA